jgi:DNA-binding NtrC family response regulator
MIRASNGGTLFIEELADLDTDTQRELLRVVDARRAGADAAPRRVITAIAADLQDRLASEPILESLFYRLNSLHLFVEPGVRYTTTGRAGPPGRETA